MNAIVEQIKISPTRRTLVVSDIHGNLPFLKGLLRKADFGPEDDLYILGDLLERSETGLETLRYVMELSQEGNVRTLLGNCDYLTLEFMDGSEDHSGDFFPWWFGRHGERCTVVKMACLAGVSLDSPADYPAARRAIGEKFAPELSFLRSLPHIFLDDDYLFVHGGVPREDRLEELDAFGCMKNDHFLEQGHSFRRWVVVGHTPVTLYREDIASAKPILDKEHRIAGIDGGCTLKADGQLNALILPPTPGGEFSYVAYDGFPVMTALDSQEPSKDPLNIRWGRSRLEVLNEGPEFSRCRHLETGREMDILTEYLFRDEKGACCEDSTDYRLPVTAGDRLSVVRRTGRGSLCKKDSATGWYFGRLQ